MEGDSETWGALEEEGEQNACLCSPSFSSATSSSRAKTQDSGTSVVIATESYHG